MLNSLGVGLFEDASGLLDFSADGLGFGSMTSIQILRLWPLISPFNKFI